MKNAKARAPDTHRQLAAALNRRLAIVADRGFYQRDSAAHLQQLQAVSEEISGLASQLPVGAEPELAHYLQRCSYDKALALLGEQPKTPQRREATDRR